MRRINKHSILIGGYLYRIIRVPRSVHPWKWGRRPRRFYLGPVMFYRRPVVR